MASDQELSEIGAQPLSEKAQELFDQVSRRYGQAKYVAGLMMAFIDVLEQAGVEGGRYTSLDELYLDFPRKLEDRNGNPLRQLVITKGDEEFGIRRAYDRVLHYFVHEKRRVSYPSSAPDATGNWANYTDWLDRLLALSIAERRALRSAVEQLVLSTLYEKVVRPEERRSEPALFEETLEHFPLSPPQGNARGERSGAALQGIVFGFFRADNPHLQVRVDRVRSGGERIGKIGDVDGYDGVRLAISAEVKQYVFNEQHVPTVTRFASSVAERGAIGVVAAVDFSEKARSDLAAEGLIPLSLAEMLKIVRMWDLAKQQSAVSAFSYYLDTVENSVSLYERYQAFLTSTRDEFAAARNWSAAPPD